MYSAKNAEFHSFSILSSQDRKYACPALNTEAETKELKTRFNSIQYMPEKTGLKNNETVSILGGQRDLAELAGANRNVLEKAGA